MGACVWLLLGCGGTLVAPSGMEEVLLRVLHHRLLTPHKLRVAVVEPLQLHTTPRLLLKVGTKQSGLREKTMGERVRRGPEQRRTNPAHTHTHTWLRCLLVGTSAYMSSKVARCTAKPRRISLRGKVDQWVGTRGRGLREAVQTDWHKTGSVVHAVSESQRLQHPPLFLLKVLRTVQPILLQQRKRLDDQLRQAAVTASHEGHSKLTKGDTKRPTSSTPSPHKVS